jgi:methyl-accepting chemotaxis protein
MNEGQDRKDFTRLNFALATGAAAAGADFIGVALGLPQLASTAATFGATSCLSFLAFRFLASRERRDVPEVVAVESAQSGAELQKAQHTDHIGPSEKDCNACIAGIPVFERMLERASAANASVAEETETAAQEIMTQLRAIDATISALLDYMDNSSQSVVAIVARTEKDIDDNRHVIAAFLERRGGDVVESETRHAKIEGMAISLAKASESIRSIARQTNMLALNAMIESSRAGEFGAGFAVVANEVKTLSKLSDRAAQEMCSGIESLRAAIRDSNVVDVEHRVEVERKELGGVSTSIGELTQQTEKLISFEMNVLGKIQTDSGQIGHSVSQLMGSIQFQDVTRQRLEHLTKISDLARDHLRGISETIASGGSGESWPSVEALAAAVDDEGPSPPRRQVHGAVIELF